ncbi:hypothetical protein [Polyangium mundeleinium]|uniref:DUF4398 domain-containing protein n=1 Tax=Polyangium mundeleinium TaxID=2995306 RepID=A0ABT5EGC9_9BACT|nr:hypothetical protein [Polyangium mundeleinium]MDC0739947.1 hypothetical protein [Polyangium mundeleinium]
MPSLVRRSRGIILAALLGVSLAALSGCGRNYGPYPATALEVNERILRIRGAFEKVKADPLANEVRLDLQRAETWIVTAEAEAKDGKVDERADLYLTTAEGQLSMIQTHYARRRAEEKLAKRREQALAPTADETSE